MIQKKLKDILKKRKIKYQFIDLNIKGLSKGELQSIKSAVGLNQLINKDSREYKRTNIGSIRTDSVKEDLLLNNPKLYKTPIVRNGKKATVGYEPEIWKEWD